MPSSSPLILSADIGGTNTRLALLNGTQLRPETARSYPNAAAPHLNAHLTRFLTEMGETPDLLALALAGPVQVGTDHEATGALTNRDWAISTRSASQAVGGARTVLLNDLQAQGYALPHIRADQLETVYHGSAAPQQSARLVIGLGTGMNIAVVHPQPSGACFVPAAEAGHIDFAPQDAELRELADFLIGTLGHVAAEDVLSGRGLSNVHHFVSGAQIAPADIIDACARGEADALRSAALMARALGAFAGDMALVHMALGGVYLVGGVARALRPYLGPDAFYTAYVNKGRFAHIPRGISVSVVCDDYAALTGAAQYAVQTR